MGGKAKQSQRTKNNVRPSSSGRSAELLNNAMRIDPGVLGTGGGKALPVLFSTLAAPLDPQLNPDFSLCLKKLNKKDPITKTKALQELSDLVKSSNVEDVVLALPSWAHHYRALTTDTDHKVREAAQTAHGAIVGVCGRRTAPQLKALLPSWLQAQYDEYAPAAAAARASLASTFPESKLPDVLTFCFAEVAAHLLDNLVGGAEANLDKKILTPEERELQWGRLAASSLRGLEFLAQRLPAELDARLWGSLAPLLQAAAFWSLSQHKLQHVRSAWYGALGGMIARFGPTFGAAHGPRAARLLLQAPGAAQQQQWACLLLLLRLDQADTWFDKKDLLVKRIIDVLENGGWGDAKSLSTVLLPLLAYLPEHMLTKEFYESFFNAVFKGLEKKSVMSSKSERQSWITSLSECLRYLALQPGQFVLEVATAVHRRWLEHALAPARDAPTSSNLVRHSAASMAALVKYWLKQSRQAGEKYDQLARNFWQNLASTMVAQIDKLSTDRNDITALLEAHTLLLQTLKTAELQEKKSKSIKFDDEPRAAADEGVALTQQCDASVLERYKHNLDNVVEKICAQYFEFASKKQVANIVFCPLLTLLKEFDEKSLFEALARHFETDSVYGLFDKVLRGWLAGDTMRCRALVDVVFLLLKHLSEKEQDAMMDSFEQFPESVVEWCMSQALSHPHRAVPAARGWLRGGVAGGAVLRAARRLVSEDEPRARSLLLMCLATDERGEMMISSPTVSSILEVVRSALRSAPRASLERLAGAAAALASELSGTEDCAALASALFHMQLHIQRESGVLSVETWCEVRGAWQDAGGGGGAGGGAGFRGDAARAVRGEVDGDLESLDIGKLEHVASLCPYLLPQFDEGRAPEQTADAAELVRILFSFPDSVDTVIETFALELDCVRARLSCPLADSAAAGAVAARSGRAAPALRKRDLVAHANRVVFRAAVLRALLLHRAEGDAPWGERLLREEEVLTSLATLLRDYAVVCSLHDGYAFWPHYEVLTTAKRHLSCAVEAVVSELSSSRSSLYARLALRAATDGYYWSLAKAALADMLREKQEDVEASKQDIGNFEDIVTGSGFYHTLQAESGSSPDLSCPLRARYLAMLRAFWLAHAHEPGVLGAAFLRAAAAAPGDPAVVVDAYYRHQHTMLYESNIATAEWRQVVSNTAIVEYLTEMVETSGWDAQAASWDFTTISLCSLIAAVHSAHAHWGCPKVAMLARAVLRLFLAARRFVRGVPAESRRRQPAPHVAHLPTEWTDIFAPDLHYNLFSIVLKVLADADDSPSAVQCAVLDVLVPVTRTLDWLALPPAHQKGALSVPALVEAGAAALSAPAHPAYKLLAHALLRALAEPLVLHDAEKLAAWSTDSAAEEEPAGAGGSGAERPALALALGAALRALRRPGELVDAALDAVKAGEETCEMAPFTDSHSLALGYLLLCDAVYSACQLARRDLGHHYIELDRRLKCSEALLPTCLRLLPAPVLRHARDGDGGAAPAHYTRMFLDPPDFRLTEPPSSLDVARLACRGVWHVARCAGGAARGWGGAANARAAHALRRLLAAHVSPALVRAQLQHVAQHARELEEAEVQIHWSTGEVVCTFRVDERPLELSISLGAAHPLPLPGVRARGAPPTAHRTQWLAFYLAYQNGTVLNALKMWMDAVAKRVQAAPQCYICYCRLQPGSGRLPRAACRQCRNKFHTECLRKWFATSSKSNCPLCRGTF